MPRTLGGREQSCSRGRCSLTRLNCPIWVQGRVNSRSRDAVGVILPLRLETYLSVGRSKPKIVSITEPYDIGNVGSLDPTGHKACFDPSGNSYRSASRSRCDCRWKAVAEMRDAAPFASRPVVLVVEDEPLIRINAVAMIEEGGFDVVEASNANEAIAMLQARTDIRIVFTDVEMPGSMDGLKLARYIRKRWPPIQLVVTSGRCHLHDSDLPLCGKFVPKPYDFDRLVNLMRSLSN